MHSFVPVSPRVDKILTNIDTHGPCSKSHVSEEKNACGKPETPQVGLGDINPYENIITLNKYTKYKSTIVKY